MTHEKMREEMRCLSKKAETINPSAKLAQHFEGYQNLLLYGAGNAGKQFVKLLKELLPQQKIYCFLDKNAGINSECVGYPVYTPDDARLNADFREKSIVVLALLLKKDETDILAEQLRDKGYKNVINAFDLLSFAPHGNCSGSAASRKIFSNEIEDVIAAFDLMKDERSKEVFFSVFRAHAEFEYSLPVLNPELTAYVDVDIPLRNKYRSFVDCGAYTGDTLDDLAKLHNVEHYFGFEPDMQSYAKLVARADGWHDKIGKSILFPLGISDKNEFLHFFATGGKIAELTYRVR